MGRSRQNKAAWLVTWAIHVGLWLLFVANLNIWEILVGLGAAAIATVAVGVVQTQGQIGFRPTARDLAEARAIPGRLFTGTAQLFRGLALQLFTPAGAPSVIAAVPFAAGGDDPESVARRALAITYTTITPNSLVLGFVSEPGLLLYHQILPGEVPRLLKVLGAGRD